MLKITYLILLVFSLNLYSATPVENKNKRLNELSFSLNPSIVKVHTANKQGNHGVGSGVVVAKDHVVTNCHVIADAKGIHVTKYGVSYPPYALLADWKHDLCILKFEYLKLKPVNLGSNDKLQYETEVFGKNYGGNTVKPHTAVGAVKGIFDLNGYKIIQSSAWFSMGASGGGLFNDKGELIGITTFKTPGLGSFYSVPVEVIKKLLADNNDISITTAAESPFWDAPEKKLPFFMQVVGPIKKENWSKLKQISIEWIANKPDSYEANYHLGLADYRLGNLKKAKHSFNKVIEKNNKHLQTYLHLYEIAKSEGKNQEMDNYRKVVISLDDSLLAD
jgi:tetratricopeptide (TPR) repeat protein